MKIPLSPRLRVCCGFIAPGDRVADVGTDHGYLGIWLLQQEIASSVIASDIVPGPLSSARQNAEKFGFGDKMEFYLSDGAMGIPRDFDTLVCAGMGADTMIHILTHAPWLKSQRYRLVLQCQSKTHLLRDFLARQGWHIAEETVLRDGRFLYTVMAVVFRPGDVLSPGQCWFSPALLENPSEELPEYYQRLTLHLKYAIDARGEAADPNQVAAYNELWNAPELQWLKEEHHDHC